MAHSKMKVGMIGGGGPGNFFGRPHRTAILMDNSAELTAGALRSKPEESIESAKELFFARGYGDWKSMLEATQLTQTLLDEIGLTSFLKTSGGKGIHIVVPLDPVHGWSEVKAFSQAIAKYLASLGAK